MFKKTPPIITILNLVLIIYFGSVQASAETRAFSLCQFQTQLADSNTDTNPLLAYMCGLTCVEGFVLDPENQDVIVYGQVDDNALPLHTQDFVVALRNANMKYAQFKDNTYYYHNPGCSIDPDPGVLGQLSKVSHKMNREESMAAKDSVLQTWHDICSQPQTVRVFGVPFNSRFASIMVEADYLLKSITDGSYVPNVPGFIGLLPATKNTMIADIEAGNPVSVGTAMNRFWFYPGDCDFVYNDNMAGISRCPVQLLTEAQYLSANADKIVGTGGSDSLALAFTHAITEQWAELAAKEPLFAELEGLFRLTALAKLMEYQKTGDILPLDYLLDEYEIPWSPVPASLKGVSRIERFQYTSDDDMYTMMLWLPSCGGVGMDIEVTPEKLTRDIEGKLQTLQNRIKETRPNKDALFWDVKG